MTEKLRYFVAKVGPKGTLFYWQPSASLRAAGWKPVRLPDTEEAARKRAAELNVTLDEWRERTRQASILAEAAAERRQPQTPPTSGYTCVYIVSAGPQLHKIGIAIDPMKRMSTLQTGSPNPLRLAWHQKVPTAIARRAERLAHARLQPELSLGEWFTVSFYEAVAALRTAIADETKRGR